MRESILYRILRLPITWFMKVFIRPTYLGLENIPKEGRIILAGNHTHIMDSVLLASATKRSIHFLAKDELWRGPKKLIFANMGLIPVNRRTKDPHALSLAYEYLNNEKVIGIFPEGTTEKGRGLLPFKYGAVKMAKETNSKIIPFAITGKYRLFSRDLKITFTKPLSVNRSLPDANDKLRKIIITLLEENNVNI